MIHHTRGVYNNGEFKDNGVSSEFLAAHIAYNVTNRYGRALFLDGICIFKGYLSDEKIAFHTQKLKDDPPKITQDTHPYQ